MTQATNTTTTGSNTNLMASSTPIRIGSGSSSFHGPHGHHHHQHIHQGNESSSPGGVAGGGGTGHQASSVPTAAGSNLQLQSQSPLAMGTSNQSLAVGVAGGSVGGASSNITPPNSAGLRQSSGLANWASDSRDKYDQADKASTDTSKLNRKESYKAQRKNYRREKKRVASELLNSLQDPAVVVLADWLKVRGTLKSWTKLWCVLKPGLLLLYKSPKIKSSHWVGTVLLTSCQVIERPSKKDGFCFKLFHPLEQSIWAPRGPDKETLGAVVQPLPTAYLIFRAPSQAAGKCWMDALELSLRCSALLLRSNSNSNAMQGSNAIDSGPSISHETQWSEADYEKHFDDHEATPTGINTRHSPYTGVSKRYSQYLAVPGVDNNKALDSSDTSLPSRSQTPLFQQLYTTMINWERVVVANAPEFQKIKNFRKFRKTKKLGGKYCIGESGGMTSTGDLSDASSVDFSPRMYAKSALAPHQSLKLRKRRLNQFTKTVSLGSMSNQTSSSIDDYDDDVANIESQVRSSSPRPLNAPPFVVNIKDLDADSQNEGATAVMSGVETDTDSEAGEMNEPEADPEEEVQETPYVPLTEEEFGETGEQVEELAEENKGLIWCLVKQVRPGMDLSKVVLPTFILEPRSFLDKLSDSYYHSDIISRAVAEDDPFTRMKTVVQWYLSGFYKKPKGLKKPYNPILGETFRCYWAHPNGSRTYYIAEQVSHHPPISAFYVTNRQDGFCISCSILAKSKFYGNSTSAVLEGAATLTLLPRGESYTLNSPYAHCKGILVGTLSMELGGKVNIDCENTGYKTELEFKLKPFLGGSDGTNVVTGKIKLGKQTLATIIGHWDSEIRIKDVKTNEESILLTVNHETKQKRLVRYVVPLEAQLPNESELLWQHVSHAIRNEDQIAATEQKTLLEEAQRTAAKERKSLYSEWETLHFQHDIMTDQWIYKYADLRPWDPRNDVKQYEANYKVLTKTRHQAPMVRTASIVSSDPMNILQSSTLMKGKRRNRSIVHVSPCHDDKSDSSQSNEDVKKLVSSNSIRKLANAIDQVTRSLDDHKRQLAMIHAKLERIQYFPPNISASTSTCSMDFFSQFLPQGLPQQLVVKTVFYTFVGMIVCFIMKWILRS